MDMDRSPNSFLEDDTCIPEELIGLLHGAAEGSVPDIVAALTANERASLAMFCYHKPHSCTSELKSHVFAIARPTRRRWDL